SRVVVCFPFSFGRRAPNRRPIFQKTSAIPVRFRFREDWVSDHGPMTILCVATYEKGQEFLRECNRQGCAVLLLTVDTLKEADWPREAIDETFYIPRDIARDSLLKGVSHIARTRVLHRIL